MILADGPARALAIDPRRSFCVAAPAGSGKTELLIQRFLALLARVAEPERVVAITFTRKAAAEMRARLVAALQAAREGTAVDGEHQRATRELALAALRVDQARGWQLIETPARLRVQTIDSLCGDIARQLPVNSGSGGDLRVADEPQSLYREAVDQFMASAGASRAAQAFRALLLHLDNDWPRCAELLLGLLWKREQWQPLLGRGGAEHDQFDAVLAALRQQMLERIDALLDDEAEEIRALLDWRQRHLSETPGGDSNGLERWEALPSLMLTRAGEWRKRVDKRDGFPPGGGEPGDYKSRMQALLLRLAERADQSLRDALQQLSELPDPRQDASHWGVLQSLLTLLPRLGAELLLAFQRRGQVDYSQVALAALDALGSDDQPGELALRLDYQIEHLLVDEFQDTSSGQFELLRRLTRGWQEHNEAQPETPRTLLLVGDAMQSIYGFRNANVGLFLQAREHGIGDLHLEPLSLSVNFRSCAGLVQWVNRMFTQVFPAGDDPQLGAIRYQPSTAAREGGDGATIQLFEGDDAGAQEVRILCSRLREGLDDPAVRSIAVLGRSRPQLQPLLEAMRREGIPFAGRDLVPLAERPVIRDLLMLCEVLQDHYDRFAWLSLLRGPWVALKHQELFLVSQRYGCAGALLESDDADHPEDFPPPLTERLKSLRQALAWGEHFRDRLALRVWVEGCWLRLGGPAAACSDADWRDAEQFLQLIEDLEQQGQGLAIASLREAVDKLYASAVQEQAKIQVMTLHKSKGLEFDWVFIPVLDGGTASDGEELLLWDEALLDDRGGRAFLFDLRAARDQRDGRGIYDFLKARRRRKRALEDRRLLYVGCTRAAQRLFLSGCISADEEGVLRPPGKASLLAPLWEAADGALPVVSVSAAPMPEAMTAVSAYRRLRSLPPLDPVPHAQMSKSIDLASNRLQRILGTAVHRCVELLPGRAVLPASCDPALLTVLEHALLEAGCEVRQLPALRERGETLLQRILSDPWARWSLDPERPERRSEWAITFNDQGELRRLVIDYVFRDEVENTHWVVDYKTAIPLPGQDVEVFIAAELARYREQLETYRRAVAAFHGGTPRCALYFLALGCHRELMPTGSSG